MAVDMKDFKERLDQLARLELAGAGEDVSGASLGPDRLIWRKLDDGTETWEVLPEFLAQQTMVAIPVNEPGTRRAKLYEKPPDHAPAHIREHFRIALMMALFAFAPVLVAA